MWYLRLPGLFSNGHDVWRRRASPYEAEECGGLTLRVTCHAPSVITSSAAKNVGLVSPQWFRRCSTYVLDRYRSMVRHAKWLGGTR